MADLINIVNEPIVTPTVARVATPVVTPTITPVITPTITPIITPLLTPIGTPMVNRVAVPVAVPIAQPTAQPVAEAVAQPVAEAVPQPVAEAVVQPTAQPVPEVVVPEIVAEVVVPEIVAEAVVPEAVVPEAVLPEITAQPINTPVPIRVVNHEHGVTVDLDNKPDTYEDLEYLGDKAVAQAVTQHLTKRYGDKQEKDQDAEEEDDETLELSPFTQSYLNSLVKPYADALAQAESKEAIQAWIPLVFEGEYLTDAQMILEKVDDVETARYKVVKLLADGFVYAAQEIAGEHVTPWDIAVARDDQLTKLFGQGSKVLPVQVTVGPNVYTHTLSQDFVFGLLNILHGNNQFVISLNGSQVPFELLHGNYTEPKEGEKLFKATLPQGTAFFNSPDVIQGVMTASKWINIDPHTMVKDLDEAINGNWVPIVF